MFQIRIHGRGGQGVVTAAELLSIAAYTEGHYAQAFPSFGSERTGAPVAAYCRIDDKPIRQREPVLDPDALIIQDATLLRQVDVLSGRRPGGYVLLNSEQDRAVLARLCPDLPCERALVIPATRLALVHVNRPLPNAPLLGGFAAMTGLVSITAVETAIRQRFTGVVADRNVAAALEAFELAESEIRELADA